VVAAAAAAATRDSKASLSDCSECAASTQTGGSWDSHAKWSALVKTAVTGEASASNSSYVVPIKIRSNVIGLKNLNLKKLS
jgi:hypothetical protein